jgi:hypothetical protein
MQGLESLDKFKNFVSDIGGLGRYEDTYIVHAAEGETVVPMEVLNNNPILKERLFETMRDMGIQPERYIVGSEFNSINPLTGQPEFFLKKIFKRLKKAVRDVGSRARKTAADISGYAAPIVGAMYGPAAGALAGGILGQYKRENPGDKNQALQMAIRGGISGLTSNLAQGQNLLTGTGMSGGTIGQAGAFRNPVDIGREQLARFGIGDSGGGGGGIDTDRIDLGTDTATATGGNPYSSVEIGSKELSEPFVDSFGYGGTKANFNIANILKNPSPTEIRSMRSFVDLKDIYGADEAMIKVADMYKLTPAKVSALVGAATYGTQLVMDKMGGGDDDDDGTTTAGYEINPILEGIFSGGSSGDLYYDYPSAIQAAEGGIMDLQDGGESTGPGTGTSDSIPAMLSDGEFVMTAKAVRGAGGGDRREGARKMYEMMDNLERTA